MKSILVVSRSFNDYSIGHVIDDPYVMAQVLASENADKVRKMEVEMVSQLTVLQPFKSYPVGAVIDDSEVIKNILDSEDVDKVREGEIMSAEDAYRWYRQKTIDKALAVNLADGVFTIFFYNSQNSSKPERQINPFEVFDTVPRAEVEDWMRRSKLLISSCYPVGVAFYDKSPDCEKIRDDFIESNPGFSARTYGHVIYIGMAAACF